MVPFEIKRLHVIGGGSKNTLLNRFTANALGIPVIAGPSEATAIGNCMIQARATGLMGDRWEMRRMINKVLPPLTIIPEETDVWEQAYSRYKRLLNAEKI